MGSPFPRFAGFPPGPQFLRVAAARARCAALRMPGRGYFKAAEVLTGEVRTHPFGPRPYRQLSARGRRPPAAAASPYAGMVGLN